MDWQTDFYEEDDGSFPVKEFILQQPHGAIAEILHVFKLLHQFNIALGMPYVRKVDQSGLRELRIKHGTDLYRILFCSKSPKKFILLHAFLKKGDKLPESDKQLAIKRMKKS